MSKVRIHIVMGTVELPNRQLKHEETSHDQIDIPCEPTWKLEEIEMVKTGRPASSDPRARNLAGTQVGAFLGSSSLFDTQFFKYRAVFTEVIREDADGAADEAPVLEAGNSGIQDVDFIEEGEDPHA